MLQYFFLNPLPMQKGTSSRRLLPPFLKTQYSSYNAIGNLSCPPLVQIPECEFWRLTSLELDK